MYLITGSNGAVGSELVRYLADQGEEVRALVHYNSNNLHGVDFDKVTVMRADIRFQDEIIEAMMDCTHVIHLAACIHVDRSRYYPYLFYETNVQGTMNVLEAARRTGAKMVHMSTCEIIGEVPEGKAAENVPTFEPRSPYAASKLCAESYVKAYYYTYDMPVNVVRGFNLVGPRQKVGTKGAVIPIFVKKAINDEQFQIYGDGQQIRDYTDVRDIVRGLKAVAESPLKGETYHLCSGKGVTVNEIAAKILEYTGSVVVPEHAPGRPGELRRSVGDNSKAYRDLGWTPTISLDDSIKAVIKHQRTLLTRGG